MRGPHVYQEFRDEAANWFLLYSIGFGICTIISTILL